MEALAKEFEKFKRSHPVKAFKTKQHRVEFLLCGKGSKTILLFHGLAGDAYSVYRFISALESDYKIICPNVPAVKGSMNEACSIIEQLLLDQNLSPSIVIGGSFGGLMAQAFWHRNINTIDRVILFDTLPPDRTMGKKNQRISKILSWLPWIIIKPLFRARLLKLFTVSRRLTDAEHTLLLFAKSQFMERFKLLTKELLLAHSHLSFDFMIHHTVPILTNWQGKLLVISADDDPASQGASKKFRTAYPFAHSVAMTNTGHLGSLLHFEQYITEIRRAAK